MVRTKPDSAHHPNDLKDDEAIVPPLDVMVRTKPNIEHHEDNNTKSNHKRKLTQSQRQHIHDSKQIISHLGHSNTEYKNFQTISIDNKSANASWLKLPSLNTLPHPYILIDKTKKPFLPVIIHEITTFDNSSGHSQMLKNLIMTLISLSQNQQEIKNTKQVLGGIMKGIGFCPGSDSGKSEGVYSRKLGLTPQKIETDNNQWTKLHQYDKLVLSRISHFSRLATNEKQSLMKAVKLPNFIHL
ncbi:hypothetical protein O181_010087 [Austropuccinia psidii MF-1]|uniref:Uncharacterized protein n=1 Tax=Austropuccinia psidii MF-1 TaxID=1389203 RepID=A0A9Q3BT17_9BASI|nr:hypothetical protein [Austropuccinia psidii MF-1]